MRAKLLQHLLASGRPVRVEAVDLVLDAGRWSIGRPPEAWSAADLTELAWFGVLRWCRTIGVDVPADAGPALQLIARYLDHDGRGLYAAVAAVVGSSEPADGRRVDQPA